MNLPRDLSGMALVSRLRPFGYETTRQTGSHLRLTSVLKGTEHHVTVPRHKTIKVGTLSAVLAEVAQYLEMSREELAKQLFA